jgi:hypothetical protein
MPKESMSTERERLFLSYLTGARYTHPCTVIIDSVLANSKTQNSFLFPVHAMFRHDCSLVVKPASTPWRLVQKKSWRDTLPIDMLLSTVCLNCCAADFGNSGGTYELPCIKMCFIRISVCVWEWNQFSSRKKRIWAGRIILKFFLMECN